MKIFTLKRRAISSSPPLGFSGLPKKNARLSLLFLIFIFSLQSGDIIGQCSTPMTSSTVNSTEEIYQAPTSSLKAGVKDRIKVNFRNLEGNTFQLSNSGGTNYELEIFSCPSNTSLTTISSPNLNELIDIPVSIFSSANCDGDFVIEFMHTDSTTLTNQTSVGPDDRIISSVLSDPMDPNSPLIYTLRRPNSYSIQPKAVAQKSICPAIGDVVVMDNTGVADSICEGSSALLTFELANLFDVFNNEVDNPLCILRESNMEIIDDEGNVVTIIQGNNSGTFSYNPSNLSPGVYQVQFNPVCEYGLIGNISGNFEVVELPNAALVDDFVIIDEVDSITYIVSNLFLPSSTSGTITVEDPSGTTTILDDDNFVFVEDGCYRAILTADDPNNCFIDPPMDTVDIYFNKREQLEFELSDTLNFCQSGTTFDLNTDFDISSIPNYASYEWILYTNGVAGTPQAITLGNTAFNRTLNSPAAQEAVTYELCLVGELGDSLGFNGYPCIDNNPDSTFVQDEFCQSFQMYNDGSGCNCTGPEVDVCNAGDNPSFTIACNFFEISLFDLVGGELNADPKIYSCSDENVILDDYESTILGFDASPGSTDDQKIEDLPGANVICEVFNFCICIDLGFLGDIEIRPLKTLYDALGCDKTISEVVFGLLGQALGGDGGGGQVVADTDGDGAFDYIVEEGYFPLSGSNVEIPNNVNNTGEITVRMVNGWPNTPTSVCGDVSVGGTDLFELLPIGAIPVVGVMIEDALEAGGCGVDLSWSSATDLTYQIINDNVPVFVNCPEGETIVISEDYSCLTELNWSVPVAYDGCNSNLLNYPTPAGEAGVRQDSGPEIGDPLAIGDYTVVYTAEACNGNTTDCTFYIEVNAGDPKLIAPNDMVLPADADACDAVVSGLAPISGAGCGTSISYFIDNASSPSGWNDVSGYTFPLDDTDIRYTMTYATPSGDSISVSDTFTITIVDAQAPIAECLDIEAQLDEDGLVTITAEELDGGSFDNCTPNLVIEVKKDGGFAPAISFDCMEKGYNRVTLMATDEYGNSSTCIASITVLDYFKDFQINMDLPEVCLEANNPEQFDFTNYLQILNPYNGGAVLPHSNVSTLGGSVVGVFAITGFIPSPGTFTTAPEVGSSPSDPKEVGYIDPFTGVYTPGSGTGYVTVSYLMTIGGMINQGNLYAEGCYKMIHESFELRQPLSMDSPECVCGDFTSRFVDLGVVEGGLEPYTIQYSGTTLDINGDDIVDDLDGEYIYSTENGHDITDFQEDLGVIRVEYTQPTWSITIVDARGCEIFRSGSCDNDDAGEAPSITCPDDIGIVYTDEYVCTSFEEWLHPDILNGLLYDNCFIRQYNYYIENADGTVEGPFDLMPLVNIEDDGSTNVDPSLFEASHNFQKGVSTVFYYAADAVGNFIECSFTVTVEDNLPPKFINCPYPPVVENSETDHCDAYVNFALPLAIDNCDVPTVTQIDNTGLTTGDRFPVGTTIMYWEAVDESDNRDTCQVKVIVNDYWNVPEIVCPEDVLQTTDEWRCDAEVYNIAPEISSICQDNLSVFYEIFSDAALTNRIECGVWDASGEKFDKGDSWVKYTVESQPLLLISEISQSAALDQLEIVNLGPASIDISCLEVVRYAIGGIYTETLPMVSMLPSLAPTILEVGEVMVFDFTEDAPEDIPICYLIQYMGVEIDQVKVNGYTGPVACSAFSGTLNSGDVYRHCEADTDAAADWVAAENCSPLTIGQLNPDLEAMPDNGTQTSLQSEPASSASCVFQVSIIDDEDPFCGELAPAPNNYVGPAITNISETTCNRSEIEIIDGCIIGLLDFNLSGNVTPADATITLISPEGVEVEITTLPASPFDYYTFKSEGIWTLDIEPNPGVTGLVVNSWSLDITCMLPFTMDDVVLPNDPDLCGAQFDWTHPWFVDNCVEGSITVEYLSDDADCVPSGGLLTDFGGYDVSEFFCVGTTTVLYTLVDEAGNDHQCSFDVTVEDVQDPVVVCPDDIIIQLDGGECRRLVCFEPLSATDNCEVVDTTYSVEPCTEFEIGITPVTITIFDEAGNSDECTFEIEIIEYVPDPYILICNDLVNISLGADCSEEITADMILEGNNYHCYEDYIITISDNNVPLATSPEVTINDVGGTYTVMVFDPDSGNTCWGEINIEDYNIPELECPADITINCLDSYDAAFTGDAVLVSCEASIEWITNDHWVDYDNCNDIQSEITRTWTVVDESGNTNNCVQTITIERIKLEDFSFPANFDGTANAVIDCGDVANNPALTSPDFTGTPTVGVHQLGAGPNCGLAINVEDDVFNLCDGSYDIIRTWTVYDGCLAPIPGVNPITHMQLIKVVDNTAAVLSCPEDQTISVNGNNCNADYQIPPVEVNDACSSYTVITDTPNGSIQGNGGFISDVPKGTFDIKYQVQDDCNNISSCEYKLTIIDAVTPDVICLEFTEVVLNSDGQAQASYEQFDNGTHDNCCLSYLQVARMDEGIFGETIDFNCNDDEVMVIMRAYDCYDNFNDCMVSVNVEDKLSPLTVCPANQTIDCNTYAADYAALLDEASMNMQNDPGLSAQEAFAFLYADFSDVTAFDNCDYELTHTVNYTVDQCGEGTINRTWTAIDPAANQSAPCTQTITVVHESDWTINFPEDWSGELEADCSVPDIGYGDAVISDDECEMIAVNYSDEIFNVSIDACYKIVRSWTAINWCTYDAVSSQENFTVISSADHVYNVTGDAYVTHTQILEIYDTTEPEVETIEDLTIGILSDCTTDFTLPDPVVLNECSGYTVTVNSPELATYGSGMQYANVEAGTYFVSYQIMDDCGNSTFINYDVIVRDEKAPTAFCTDELVIELMSDGNGGGMAQIDAADFNVGSFDNCTAEEELSFSFSSDINETTAEFDCSHVTELQVISMYVWDAEGNSDYCVVSLDVQDNNAVCSVGTLTISGAAATENDNPVENVAVEINGGTFSSFTDANGEFSFGGLAAGGDYSVNALLDSNPTEGVTTFDIVLITQHILGMNSLDSPYKIIAADANNSGAVSTLDIVSIRKLILTIDQNFPNNTSWRFVDASYSFQDPTDPWAGGFPEVVNFNNLAEDALANFVAIKVGDVNGSAASGNLLGAQNRNLNKEMTLKVEDALLSKNQPFSVDFSSEDIVSGFQFSIAFNPELISFRTLENAVLTEQNFGFVNADNGIITVSWNKEKAISLEGDKLFTLQFTAHKDIRLSEAITVNSAATKAEAYDANSNIIDIKLDIQGQKTQDIATLYQNVPNPFKGQTSIAFYLPEAADASISIRDINGKLVQRLEGNYKAGYNSIRVENLPSGVLYYTLKANDFSETRKMIKF